MIRATPGRGSAARPDAIRRHNLALILGHVHRDGFLTRAELTQRLGVSRSCRNQTASSAVHAGIVNSSANTMASGSMVRLRAHENCDA